MCIYMQTFLGPFLGGSFSAPDVCALEGKPSSELAFWEQSTLFPILELRPL